MIRFEDVTTGSFSDLSFELRQGSICKVIASSDHDGTVFLDTLLGLNRPDGGKVSLFEQDIHESSESELMKIFGHIGMVWREGGLISNLKVGENIVLPLWYHRGTGAEEVEERVVQLFKEVLKDVGDLPSYMRRLSGALPLHEKRLVGFVRTLLMEPDLIIYDSPLEGLVPDTAENLTRLASAFQSKKSERSAIYVTAQEDVHVNIKADFTIKQRGKRFVPWES